MCEYVCEPSSWPLSRISPISSGNFSAIYPTAKNVARTSNFSNKSSMYLVGSSSLSSLPSHWPGGRSQYQSSKSTVITFFTRPLRAGPLITLCQGTYTKRGPRPP